MRFQTLAALAALLALAACSTSMPYPGEAQLVSADHYVRVKSTAPAMAGDEARLYVREAGTMSLPRLTEPPRQ